MKGIAGKLISLKHIALIKFKVGNTFYSHYFRIIEDGEYNPIFGQDLLKRLLTKIDMETNRISFFKNPRRPSQPETGFEKENISPEVVKMIKQQKSANVFTTKFVTIPAKSFFYLPVNMKNEQQDNVYYYVTLLQTITDRYGLRDLSLKMEAKNPVILVVNPTSHHIHLKKGTPIAYTEDKVQEITLTTKEAKENNTDVYKYRTKEEIQKRLAETKGKFNTSLFDINPKLPNSTKEKISKLLYRYRDVFSYSQDDIGFFRGYEHRIKIDKSASYHKRSPPIPPGIRDQIDAQIEQLLKAKIIEETSTSAFSSPLLVIKKPHTKEFRLVLNLSLCNKYTRYLSIPFESSEDVLTSLRNKKVLSTIDISQSYFQIRLHPKSRKYMTFEVPHTKRSYMFNRVVMGHSTSAQSLSLVTRMLLEGLPNRITNFADDIVIGSYDNSQQLGDLEQLLLRLRRHDFRASPRKTHLFYPELDVLGFRVSGQSISISKRIADKIRKFQRPTTKRKLKGFLGLCSFLRAHISHFTDRIEPLQKLLSKNSKYKWDQECDQIFEKLKEDILNAPSLSHFNENADIRVYTDASSIQAGGILSCYNPKTQ